jgi:hypothetical protein
MARQVRDDVDTGYLSDDLNDSILAGPVINPQDLKDEIERLLVDPEMGGLALVLLRWLKTQECLNPPASGG